MRPKRDKQGHAAGRSKCAASFLDDPSAKVFLGTYRLAQRREKVAANVGPWKLTPLMEIRKERGFPQRLEKSLANDARLFHSSHRPGDGAYPPRKLPRQNLRRSAPITVLHVQIELDDRDHLLQNPTASVASLRRLIDISLER